MQYAYNTDLDAFGWFQHKGYGQQFNNHMGGYRLGRLPWMAPGFFPVKERLLEGADSSPDAVTLVDIGGNVGHDLELFHKYHPDAPGKFALQDLPTVVSEAKNLSPKIVPMAHNFFEEQPVKGELISLSLDLMVPMNDKDPELMMRNQVHERTTCTAACTIGQTKNARRS